MKHSDGPRPVVILQQEMPFTEEGEEWREKGRVGVDAADLRRQCKEAFGQEVPVILLPPGVSLEVYWFDPQGPQGLRDPVIDLDDDEEDPRDRVPSP